MKEEQIETSEESSENSSRSRTFRDSVRDATKGVLHTFATEDNMRHHLGLFQGLMLFVVIFRPTLVWIGLISIMSGLMFTAELFNTAMERIVDLAANGRFSMLAKQAKDCAAGGVLMLASTALLVALGLCISVFPFHFYFWTTYHLIGVICLAVWDTILVIAWANRRI